MAGKSPGVSASLVKVRHDSVQGWIVTCRICGKLAALLNFWPASRMAADHETIHHAN